MINDLLELLKSKKLNFKTIETSKNAFIIEFDVKAKPSARVEKIFIDSNGMLVVQTRAKPVDGEANQDIIEKVSDLIGVPKYHVEILRGDKSKNKRIKLMVEITAKKNELYFQNRINDFLIQEA